MSFPSRPRPGALLGLFPILAVLPLTLLVGACDDNISCVFTTGCGSNQPDALGSAPALRPETDDWILAAPPEIVASFPGGAVAETTPVMVVFSETVDPSTLDTAFQLQNIDVGGGGQPPIPLGVLGTFAAGRVVVLQAVAGAFGGGSGIPIGNYEVRLTADAEIRDVTGQELGSPGALTTFNVTATPPAEPVLVGSFPLDGENGQSDVPEVVLVFDREMDAATVTSDSVRVQLGGVDPVFDPDPEAFVPSPLVPVPDTRVFTWREVNPMGDPVSLGVATNVTVELSPSGAAIATEEMTPVELPPTNFGFVTSPVPRPSGISLLSIPTDAIGPATLTPGDADELMLQVDVLGEGGDVVDLFVFGVEPEGDDPVLFAVQREKELPGMGPVGSTTFDATDADLTTSLMPLTARFADGGVSFAARLRRGTFLSPVVVLDVDDDQAGVQDPTLDLTGPSIVGFLTDGGVDTEFVTDQRDLVLAGDAGEELSIVEVSTASADNGVLAPVLATNGDLFLAAPVDLGGTVDGPVPFTVVVYDAARNASDPLDATFVQRGRVGPDALVPGGTIEVEVYDAATLQVLADARVSTHSDDGVTTTFLGFADTDATGAATVSAASGADATLLTVDLVDYDLWTFHGVPTGKLSIPLERSAAAATEVLGTVLLDDLVEQTFLEDGAIIADSRRGPFEDAFAVNPLCAGAGILACGFDPFEIRPGRVGAASFLAGDYGLTPATFDVADLLEGYELVLPLRNGAEGATLPVGLAARGAFQDPDFDEEAVEVLSPGITIDGSLTTGVDLANLVDAPEFAGPTRVTVEATVDGVAGSVPVGLGLSDPTMTPGVSLARLGVPDSVRPGGAFADLLHDPADLYVRVELLDTDGNLAVSRELESTVLANGRVMFPANVPVLAAPTGTTTGDSYEVLFDNSIFDVQAVTGLYRVELAGSGGRSWTLWTADPDDATAQVRVVVPDLAGAGGAGLASGTVDARLVSVGAPGLAPGDFLWSDLDRDYTVLSRSETFQFTQP